MTPTEGVCPTCKGQSQGNPEARIFISGLGIVCRDCKGTGQQLSPQGEVSSGVESRHAEGKGVSGIGSICPVSSETTSGVSLPSGSSAPPADRNSAIDVLYRLSGHIAANAIAHGFTNSSNDDRTLMLIVGELAEAHDALRHGNPPSDHIPEFSGMEEELADVIIRCLDMGYQRGWKLPEAILAKMEFNRTRPFKHGGKLF